VLATKYAAKLIQEIKCSRWRGMVDGFPLGQKPLAGFGYLKQPVGLSYTSSALVVNDD
jgi:hypothetical protein